jgi:Ion transport protein
VCPWLKLLIAVWREYMSDKCHHLQIGGYGLSFFSDGFNVFDFIVVVVSVIELGFTSGGSGSSLSALRSFRTLRILKSFRVRAMRANDNDD